MHSALTAHLAGISMNNNGEIKRRLLKGDYVVFIVILALAFGLMLYYASLSTGAEYGEIWENGKLTEKIKLADGFEKKVTIKGEKITNIIEIKGKQMRFAESDCFDESCVHTGWISRSGQVAVCLPNHVMLKITGKDSNNDVDVIVK